MDDDADTYGKAIRDYYENEEGFEIIERDDGFIAPSGGPEMHFSEYEAWSDHEKQALEDLEGPVLDVGCGAG